MATVLRARGTNFDPDRFCSESDLKPCRLYRRGEPRLSSKPEGSTNEESGINVVLSEADFHEFTRQVEETMEFLRSHKDELARLRDFSGIEAMTIDFGINRRDGNLQCDFFPPALIRLAGELNSGIELSQYPVQEDEPSEGNPP